MSPQDNVLVPPRARPGQKIAASGDDALACFKALSPLRRRTHDALEPEVAEAVPAEADTPETVLRKAGSPSALAGLSLAGCLLIFVQAGLPKFGVLKGAP